jgi:hypothetical protein
VATCRLDATRAEPGYSLCVTGGRPDVVGQVPFTHTQPGLESSCLCPPPLLIHSQVLKFSRVRLGACAAACQPPPLRQATPDELTQQLLAAPVERARAVRVGSVKNLERKHTTWGEGMGVGDGARCVKQ